MRTAFTHFYEFGPFRFDYKEQRLYKNDELVSLPPKAMEALLVLVQHPGELLERERLMEALWADAFVEDANLTVTISSLRKALGKSDDATEYIETIRRVGYRFVADVHEKREPMRPLVVEKHTVSRTVIEEEEIPSDLAVVTSLPAAKPVTSPLTKARIVLAVAGIVVVGILAVVLFTQMRRSVSSGPRIKSLAVLPFKVAGSDTANEHQGLGMADILITRLSNLKQLSVRPTSAILAFDRVTEESVSVGAKLKVDAVLEGTIYQVGDRVRITARLLKVSDQSSLWAGEFEKSANDQLGLQDEIAMRLVDALALPIGVDEKNALTKPYTKSSDAYELYLKGRYQWNKRNYSGMVEAQRLFRNAIEKDQSFALAYVGLADTLATGPAVQEAMEVTGRALVLDPNLAEAYATQGFILMFHNWQWKAAEASLRKSIELKPNYATAHQWYSTLLGIEGRNEEAIASMRRALEINPMSYNLLADLGQLYYFARQYDEAKTYCYRALDVYPDFVRAHEYLHYIHLKTGEDDKAIEEILKADAENSVVASDSEEKKREKIRAQDVYRKLYAQGGIKEYLKLRVMGVPYDASGLYVWAHRYAALGDKEKTLEYLEKSYQGHGFLLAFVKADPMFDLVRTEPRYQTVVRTMGLE